MFWCQNNCGHLVCCIWTRDKDDVKKKRTSEWSVLSFTSTSLCSLYVTRIREPKKTISSTFFNYGWRIKNVLLLARHLTNVQRLLAFRVKNLILLRYNDIKSMDTKPRQVQIAAMEELLTAMQNGLWNDKRYGRDKICTLYIYNTCNSTLTRAVLKCPSYL